MHVKQKNATHDEISVQTNTQFCTVNTSSQYFSLPVLYCITQ